MTYIAHAVNARTEQDAARPFDTAATAAGNLEVLLRLDGWPGETEETVRRLVAGETLVHRNFSYRVLAE